MNKKIIHHRRMQLNRHNSSIYKNMFPFVAWILDYRMLSWWSALVSPSPPSRYSLSYFTNIANFWVGGTRSSNSLKKRSNFNGSLLSLVATGSSLSGRASSVYPSTFPEDENGLLIHGSLLIRSARLDWFRAVFGWMLVIRNLRGWAIIVRIVWLVLGYLSDELYSRNVKECKKLIRIIGEEERVICLSGRLENYPFVGHLWSSQELMIEYQLSWLRGYLCIQSPLEVHLLCISSWVGRASL